MKDKGWSRRFDDPIALSDGRELATLRDAGDYVTGLPPEIAAQQHWQTATRELLMAAERGGLVLLAEWAMRQALHHGREEPEKPPRKKAVKRYRVVR